MNNLVSCKGYIFCFLNVQNRSFMSRAYDTLKTCYPLWSSLVFNTITWQPIVAWTTYAKWGLIRRICKLRDSDVENTKPTVDCGYNKRKFVWINFFLNSSCAETQITWRNMRYNSVTALSLLFLTVISYTRGSPGTNAVLLILNSTSMDPSSQQQPSMACLWCSYIGFYKIKNIYFIFNQNANILCNYIIH